VNYTGKWLVDDKRGYDTIWYFVKYNPVGGTYIGICITQHDQRMYYRRYIVPKTEMYEVPPPIIRLKDSSIKQKAVQYIFRNT